MGKNQAQSSFSFLYLYGIDHKAENLFLVGGALSTVLRVSKV
jgi:hypothetical protein